MKNHNLRLIIAFIATISIIILLALFTNNFISKVYSLLFDSLVTKKASSLEYSGFLLGDILGAYFSIFLGIAMIGLFTIFIIAIIALIHHFVIKWHSNCNESLYLILNAAPFLLIIAFSMMPIIKNIVANCTNTTFNFLLFALFISTIINYLIIFRRKNKIKQNVVK